MNRKVDNSGIFHFPFGPHIIRVAAQPVVSRDRHGWHNSFYEVLVRPTDATGQKLNTAAFIDKLEATKDIYHFDAQMLERACRIMESNRGVSLSVNISARTLANRFFSIADIIHRHPTVTSQLIIEVTERHSMTNAGQIRSVIHGLHSTGVRVAMDDVGTPEACSVDFLANLRPRVDILKLDRCLLDDAEKLNYALKIAERHGISTLVEGIEDPVTAHRIGQQSKFMQGYFFGYPTLQPFAWNFPVHRPRRIHTPLAEQKIVPRI